MPGRPSGTGVAEYARRVAADVRGLIAAGADPRRITVVGFSKGGAVFASSELARPEVSFVFLGACHDAIMNMPQLHVAGRILSIYEASDKLGVSCAPLLGRAAEGSVIEEIRIDTGDRHGAFYRPRDEWLLPTLAWIRR